MKAWGLASIALFLYGVSIPFNKILLDFIDPFSLNAAASLGSCFVLLVYILFTRSQPDFQIRVRRNASLKWLGASLLTGGAIAPLMSITGLSLTSAAVSSLLFNFEIIFGVFFAAILFREKVSRLAWIAALLVFAGGIFTSWEGGKVSGTFLGVFMILFAAVFWGLDSNFLKQVQDVPFSVISFLQSAAAFLVALAFWLIWGKPIPSMGYLWWACLLGATCYAASNVIFLSTLRSIGAARTSTVFGAAPFIGAILSILILDEKWNLILGLGMGLMVIGVGLLLRERRGMQE